jgi:TolB-like protein/DNA-binding winged helix-turn-helix (wHTH) protein/Tfp pilus assembly protein PilF
MWCKILTLPQGCALASKPVEVQQPIRFAEGYELDLRPRRLRRGSRVLRLERIPLEILILLLEHRGEIVTRDQIVSRVWGQGVFLDTDNSIRGAIRKLRQVLKDDAKTPRFIQTVTGQGYRFVATIIGPEREHRADPFGAQAAAAPEAMPKFTSELNSWLQSRGLRIEEEATKRKAEAPGDAKSDRGPLVPALSASDAAPAPLEHPQGVPLEALGGAVPARRPAPTDPWPLRLVGVAAMLLVGVAAGWFVWHRFEPHTDEVTPGTVRSLAVLPLDNLSGDPQQEYFADGITEALIADLGQISALRVISRTSVMRYKGTKKSLPEIAGELNVDAVAEGSVVREGNRVRITAQLIEAKTDRHLWAHSYERDLTSVLALQGEVAQAIANEIKIKVTQQEQVRLAQARPVNPEAHELYLRGWYSLNKAQVPADAHKAIDYFLQAIDKDPSHALAHAGLAAAYDDLGEGEGSPSSETFSKAKAAAAKAVELDDTLAEGHAAFATAVMNLDWDWARAEREFRRALEINPNSAPVHAGYSLYLTKVGRLPEAISEAKREREIDPLRLNSYMDVGQMYYYARQYDQALEQTRKAFELDPNVNASWLLGFIYAQKGIYPDAIRAFEQERGNPYVLGHLGNAYARSGRVTEAHETIAELKERLQKENVTYSISLVYAGLGEKDQAFEWLERAYKAHDKGLTYLKVDPPLDPLRSDPRFQDLLRRMNFPL